MCRSPAGRSQGEEEHERVSATPDERSTTGHLNAPLSPKVQATRATEQEGIVTMDYRHQVCQTPAVLSRECRVHSTHSNSATRTGFSHGREIPGPGGRLASRARGQTGSAGSRAAGIASSN